MELFAKIVNVQLASEYASEKWKWIELDHITFLKWILYESRGQYSEKVECNFVCIDTRAKLKL